MIARTVGWTLIHSTWEIAGICLAFFLVSLMAKRASSNIRYAVALSALILCLAFPVATYGYLKLSEPATVGATAGRAESVHNLKVSQGTLSTSSKPIPSNDSVLVAEARPTGFGKQIEPILPKVVLIWLVGLLAMCIRLAGGLYSLHRLKRTASPELDDTWQELTESVASRIGLKRSVSILFSDRIESPAVIGFLKSVVLFPVNALTRLSPGQIEALIAHEVAHIRRHDMLVNLFQSLIETVLFYHPAVWWISSVVRSEREHCCDDLAIQVTGDRAGYARALVCLEEIRRAPRMAMAANRGSLLTRVQRILLGVHTQRVPAASWLVVAVVVLSSAALAQAMRPSPKPLQAPTETVYGIVTQPDGKPAQHATVYLQQFPTPLQQGKVIKLETDDSGRFQGMAQNSAPFFCLAELKGKGIGARVSMEAYKSFDIRLLPERSVKVLVKDSSGHPLKHFKIGPIEVFTSFYGLQLAPEVAESFATTTDEQGRAVVDHIPSENGFALGALDHRYVRTINPYVVPTQATGELTVTASLGSAFGGVVTADGRPVAGAQVFDASGHGHPIHQYTDANGRFSFDQLRPGKYTLAVNLAKTDWSQYVAAPTHINATFGRRPDLAIRLEHGTKVSGKINFPDRKSTVPTSVLFNRSNWSDFRGEDAKVDPQGNFEIYLPGGTYTAMSDNPFGQRSKTVVVKDGVEGKIGIDAPSGTKIPIEAIDADGKRARNTTIQYYYKTGANYSHWVSDGALSTDNDGNAAVYLTDDQAKSVHFKAQRGDEFSDPAVFPHDGKAVIQLHRVGLVTVKGFVKDMRGNPIAHAVVRARFSGDPDFLGDLENWSDLRFTNSDGYYEFKRIYPGVQASLNVHARGFADAEAPEFKAPAQGEFVSPEFRLPDGSDLQGTVVDQHGTPIAGCEVFADNAFRANTDRLWTDKNGHFKIDSLAKGSYRVSIYKHYKEIHVRAETGVPARFTMKL
jgi:beta-lactamase regulating signal transducer with metallopeptidase domain/uncharacterized GH25 family protein